MKFNSSKTKNDIIKWIRDWFSENGDGCNAVVGISGGKDSSVVAALCCEALGNDRVIGVMMPNGTQTDLDVGIDLVKHLNIKHYIINISGCYDALMSELDNKLSKIDEQTKINLPPRLRMSTLYAVAQSHNGRVANTCNLSEDWVGYSTRYGDSVGDFSPLSFLTVQEVKAVGKELDLPDKFINKIPTDGLCGQTDEDKLGFTYATLDKYIREGICDDKDVKAKIDRLHQANLFKLNFMPCFKYEPNINAD